MFDINDFLKIGLAQRIHNGISGFFCGFQHKQITSGIYSLGNGGTTQVYYSKVALNGAIFLWVIEWTNGMDRFLLRILNVKEESLIEKGICKFSCSRCISFIDYI